MKTLTLLIALVAAAASGAIAQAQTPVGPNDVRIDKIAPAVVKTPEYQIASGGQKRFENKDWLEVEVAFSTAADLIDELTFKYYIGFAGTLLVGEVTHVSIPKGKGHFSVVYVAPRTMSRLLEGKTLTSAAIQNVWVQISRQGQILAQDSMRKEALPNLPQVTGFVLNKNETPFFPLYWDRYEAIKPTR